MSSHLTAANIRDQVLPEAPAETSIIRPSIKHPSVQSGPAATLDEVRLLGQPPLQRHLAFVHDNVVNGAAMTRAELADDWRRANDYYYDLE
ncbi:MAG: hypothetical protein ACR2QF_08530, partial [Geminicoccaceae bacterium]